jgi:hypothetical protein
MEEFSLVFGPDESLSQAPSNIAHEFLEKTKQYWHNFTQMLKIPFEWQSDVIRSAITLKLCSFEEVITLEFRLLICIRVEQFSLLSRLQFQRLPTLEETGTIDSAGFETRFTQSELSTTSAPRRRWRIISDSL